MLLIRPKRIRHRGVDSTTHRHMALSRAQYSHVLGPRRIHRPKRVAEIPDPCLPRRELAGSSGGIYTPSQSFGTKFLDVLGMAGQRTIAIDSNTRATTMQSHTVPVASVVIGGSGNIIVAEIMSGRAGFIALATGGMLSPQHQHRLKI